jgi:DNA-binding HxlR family transcriptional regulator
MALLDLLGRRWVLRILWELRDRELKFRELQAACDGVSASVLAERVRDLRDAGVLETVEESGYRLSTRGRSLLLALRGLDAWAKEWG